MPNAPYYENRLVAFLDVHGFAVKLREKPLCELHAEFAVFSDTARTKTFFRAEGDDHGRTNFEFSQFMSDSIILVSHEINDPYNVNNFVSAVATILELGIKTDFPLRGAITLANVIYDQPRNLFLSDRFPDAVKFEGQQEWTGCAILSDAAKVVVQAAYGVSDPELAPNSRTDLVHFYPVPLKNGVREEMLCVNYLFSLGFEDISEPMVFLTEPKKGNTDEYCRFVFGLSFVLQDLDEPFLPATHMTLMKTRTGFRALFLDSEMRPCDPGVDEFHWHAVGQVSPEST